MIINFYKYQGTGNDFIIIDDRKNIFDINNVILISSLCDRRYGIGADGLILLRDHDQYDFEMIYFNSDGYQSTMCGNGGRCIIHFAQMLKIVENKTLFIAIDGVHKGYYAQEIISIQMKDVESIKLLGEDLVIDTGSPHYVQQRQDLDNIDVDLEGRGVRRSEEFLKSGINVNFVKVADNFQVRTYERGVEKETLSCGTGVVASVIAMHYINNINQNTVKVDTKGGYLEVSFEENKGVYRNIWLSGKVSMIYSGKIEC